MTRLIRKPRPIDDRQSEPDVLSLYRWTFTARCVDRLESELVARGEAPFHIGGDGHEGVVALAPHLTEADWLHLHYRDKALALARGVPPSRFFDAVLCKAASDSHGRQLSAHINAPELRILSLPIPVATNALQAVGVAAEVRGREKSLVLCCVGDAGTQQGEFLEALQEAARDRLPMLFVVEDNGYSISTPTAGRTAFHIRAA